MIRALVEITGVRGAIVHAHFRRVEVIESIDPMGA
jgi:hypothetical protein